MSTPRPCYSSSLNFLLLLTLVLLATQRSLAHPISSEPTDEALLLSSWEAPESNRWYGEEAKELLRKLEELKGERMRKERAEEEQRANMTGGQKQGRIATIMQFLQSLFTEKANDEGPKHDCFFSVFNCPVNPARNIPGVQRIRISVEEREQLLAVGRGAASRRQHKRRRTRGGKL